MKRKIFRSFFFASTCILIASVMLITGAMYAYFNIIEERQLELDLNLASGILEKGGEKELTVFEKNGCRITRIDENGRVIYDSVFDEEEMDNHLQREEVKEAFEKGEGKSTRFSDDYFEKTVYRARLLSDGTVLRVCESFETVLPLIMGMIRPIAIILIFALFVSLAVAKRLSRKIIDPLLDLDLENPLENNTYDELSPLLMKIERQSRQIQKQITEHNARKDEFDAVFRNMSEGLVVLNSKGIILSINTSAMEFFSVGESSEGRTFLEIERDHEIDKTMQKAAEKGHASLNVNRGGKVYELNASRVSAEKGEGGMILLIFDDTEKAFAEQNRREFTANVSHELKTPLQSILGSAELIEQGLVKTEDIGVFAGNIRSQAARLVTLIEDIIRLSQLDEGEDIGFERVDLFLLAQGEIDALKEAAKKRSIKIHLEGESVFVLGVPQLLHEIIYNLCDNAIRYNKDGGSVTVTVRKSESGSFVSVRDTGIGIPQEHQGRVFERFYRVDKSHSANTGGTGLGLSIVKHAVAYSKGKITLKSTVGEGTEIRVDFPETER